MAGCPIIRFTKHKTNASISGSAGHHLRTIPTKNADPDLTPENQVLMGLDTPKGIQKKIMEMTEPLVKRKDNVRCLEVFLGASDDFWDSGGDWTALARAHKWMLIDEFGEQNVVAYGWHLDEGRPHGWAYITPIAPGGRLAASHWLDGPSKLKQMLTRVQPHYSALGMSRAKEGVRASHVDMHTIHAANAGNARAKKQLDDEMQARRDSALKQTQKAEKKAVQAKERADRAQAELEQVQAQKSQAKAQAEKIISDAKAQADKLMIDAKGWLKVAESHIEKREKAIKKEASENEKLRRFLNGAAKELKSVFQLLPETVFLQLPDALQSQLVRFFKLTPIQPVEPAKIIPLPESSKAAKGLLNTLAKPSNLLGVTPKP